MTKILVVDDKKSMRDMISLVLIEKGYETFSCGSVGEAVKLLKKEKVDILITDMKMPRVGGMELLAKLPEVSPTTAAIMITAHGTIQDAVSAMKLGAVDFIEKPFSIEELEKKISQLIDKRKFQEQKEDEIFNLVGQSEPMQKLRSLIEKVASATSSVLIIGESGTGKELVAREIHGSSERKNSKFIAVNCSALVETLLENELFGHEKGAYTGAESMKKGRFELADKGSLFLDEIAEMPYNLQAKFLRVLQEKNFERVGGTESISVDVRIIAATNKDLSLLVKEGKFREDLYYRLNVITIKVPTLRERKGDITALSNYYLSRDANKKNINMAFSPKAMGYLQAYSWPGNIRQLKNVIERGVILAEQENFTTNELPPEIWEELNLIEKSEEGNLNITEQLELIEKESIRQVLEKHNGNQTKAAKELGLGRTALQYKMKKYGLSK